MLQENLQHARHVENERITYHGFFAAMVAGALALIAGMADKENRCLWKRKQLSKKTGIELNIEISKGAKAVLSVIMTALLSVVVWIHMDHI